jgi:hypothetical protein
MKIHQIIRTVKRGPMLSRKKMTQLFTTSDRAQKEITLYVKLICSNLSFCPYVSNLVLASEYFDFFFFNLRLKISSECVRKFRLSHITVHKKASLTYWHKLTFLEHVPYTISHTCFIQIDMTDLTQILFDNIELQPNWFRIITNLPNAINSYFSFMALLKFDTEGFYQVLLSYPTFQEYWIKFITSCIKSARRLSSWVFGQLKFSATLIHEKKPSFHKGTNQLFPASDKQILFQLVTKVPFRLTDI